jgi:hypothetical protein
MRKGGAEEGGGHHSRPYRATEDEDGEYRGEDNKDGITSLYQDGLHTTALWTYCLEPKCVGVNSLCCGAMV